MSTRHSHHDSHTNSPTPPSSPTSPQVGHFPPPPPPTQARILTLLSEGNRLWRSSPVQAILRYSTALQVLHDYGLQRRQSDSEEEGEEEGGVISTDEIQLLRFRILLMVSRCHISTLCAVLAKDSITRALEIRPNDVQALILAGKVERMLGRHQECVEMWDRILGMEWEEETVSEYAEEGNFTTREELLGMVSDLRSKIEQEQLTDPSEPETEENPDDDDEESSESSSDNAKQHVPDGHSDGPNCCACCCIFSPTRHHHLDEPEGEAEAEAEEEQRPPTPPPPPDPDPIASPNPNHVYSPPSDPNEPHLTPYCICGCSEYHGPALLTSSTLLPAFASERRQRVPFSSSRTQRNSMMETSLRLLQISGHSKGGFGAREEGDWSRPGRERIRRIKDRSRDRRRRIRREGNARKLRLRVRVKPHVRSFALEKLMPRWRDCCETGGGGDAHYYTNTMDGMSNHRLSLKIIDDSNVFGCAHEILDFLGIREMTEALTPNPPANASRKTLRKRAQKIQMYRSRVRALLTMWHIDTFPKVPERFTRLLRLSILRVLHLVAVVKEVIHDVCFAARFIETCLVPYMEDVLIPNSDERGLAIALALLRRTTPSPSGRMTETQQHYLDTAFDTCICVVFAFEESERLLREMMHILCHVSNPPHVESPYFLMMTKAEINKLKERLINLCLDPLYDENSRVHAGQVLWGITPYLEDLEGEENFQVRRLAYGYMCSRAELFRIQSYAALISRSSLHQVHTGPGQTMLIQEQHCHHPEVRTLLERRNIALNSGHFSQELIDELMANPDAPVMRADVILTEAKAILVDYLIRGIGFEDYESGAAFSEERTYADVEGIPHERWVKAAELIIDFSRRCACPFRKTELSLFLQVDNEEDYAFPEDFAPVYVLDVLKIMVSQLSRHFKEIPRDYYFLKSFVLYLSAFEEGVNEEEHLARLKKARDIAFRALKEFPDDYYFHLFIAKDNRVELVKRIRIAEEGLEAAGSENRGFAVSGLLYCLVPAYLDFASKHRSENLLEIYLKAYNHAVRYCEITPLDYEHYQYVMDYRVYLYFVIRHDFSYDEWLRIVKLSHKVQLISSVLYDAMKTPFALATEHLVRHVGILVEYDNQFRRWGDLGEANCGAELPLLEKCGQCGRWSTKHQTCSRCKKSFYCSSRCQRTHWRVHRDTCRPVSATTIVFNPPELNKN